MPIETGPHLNERDVYIDHPFEELMYRRCHITKNIYLKNYGKKESLNLVDSKGKIYNDALLYGDEITKEVYLAGKPRR